jgi:hypothetical protein
MQQAIPHRGIHTDYNELVRLPDEIKQKLFLIHYRDDAKQKDSEVTLLEQGRVYDIP